MRGKFDLSLYLVTDPGAGAAVPNIVEAALRGGVTMVQLREKEADTKTFFERACLLKKITDAKHVPLIINDRLDICLAADAAGLHIGQSDLPASVARKWLPADKILGVSAHTVEEAKKAEQDGADYLGVGAVFPTATKPDAETVSIKMLKEICETVRIPVVAIGGIGEENVGELAGSGVAGTAVVSAIMSAQNPREAALRLKGKIFSEIFQKSI